MAANATYLMRAFRTIDSSFHTWRAGEFDSDMSETTPPNPVGEYSDFIVVAYIGGNVAVSDTAETEVLYTAASPAVIPATFGADASSNLDTRNFREVEFTVYVTSKGSVTLLDVDVQYSTKASPSTSPTSADWASFQAELITTGVAAENDYVYSKDITSLSAPFTLSVTMPVRGTFMRVRVDSTGSNVGSLMYVTATRRI